MSENEDGIQLDPREHLIAWLEPFAIGALQQAFYNTWTGSAWQWYPESPESGYWLCEWCEDCRTFHSYTKAAGFRVENGKLCLIPIDFDEDGDWTECDSIPIECPSEIGAWEQKSMLESQECQVEYYEYVIESRLDPLGEFFPYAKHWQDLTGAVPDKPIEEAAAEALETCKRSMEKIKAQEIAAWSTIKDEPVPEPEQ